MDFNIVQKQLAEALSNKDLIDFEICLDMGADPLYMDDNTVCCVYERTLSTYGCAEFVEKCLRNGCCPNYVNCFSSKSAINYAADSKDPDIIIKILRYPGINVNHKFQHQTAIHTLVHHINNNNVDDIITCIELLLSYGASPLIADELGMYPLQHVMTNSNVSPEVKLKVLKLLEPYKNLISNEENVQEAKLFFESIVDKDNNSFDVILEKGLQAGLKYDNKTPFDCAISVGNYYALKKLLYIRDTSLNSVANPLIAIVKNWKEDSVTHDFRKCFYLLLKSNEIDINAKDECHFSALHYAVENHNDEAMRELLKRGAFIGAKSLTNMLAVDGIPPEILQECFDNCVSSNGFEMDDHKFELAMSYENLMPKSANPLKGQFDADVMAVMFIAKSDKLRYLVQHPVISSYLNLKWSRLSFMFYASFLMYVLFAISMSGFIVLKFCGHDYQQTLTLEVFRILSCLGIVYMIIKEFIQLLNERVTYFRFLSNYIELTMIVMAIITCSPNILDRSHQRVIAVSTILLISVEIFLLTGTVPMYSMSTHMLMFEAVCKSFLKSFMLYAIFLATFSMSFYILFNQGEGSPMDFNKFSTPMGTVVKTIVMLTGEFDTAAMEFNTTYSYILFLLFVFLMTIVLYNLLNGLAVSDIQAIQGQAEQSITISRINLIIRYGTAFARHSNQLKFSVNLNRFQHLYGRFMNLNSHNQQDNLQEANRLNGDIEINNCKTTFRIKDQGLIELAMDILEQKKAKRRRQRSIRASENRFNEIDKKLRDVFEILKDIQEKRK